jgi:hypothetical protein
MIYSYTLGRMRAIEKDKFDDMRGVEKIKNSLH